LCVSFYVAYVDLSVSVFFSSSSLRTGICSAADRLRLDRFLNRCKRLGFCYRSTVSHGAP